MFNENMTTIDDGTPILTFGEAYKQFRQATDCSPTDFPYAEEVEDALTDQGWTYIYRYDGWVRNKKSE
jgi:hypothetical protein